MTRAGRPPRAMRIGARAGFTLIELIVVIAIVAIGFASVVSMLLSGTTAFNKVNVQTRDRYVAMMVTQSIEKELRYATAVTLYDPPSGATQPADRPCRIRTVGGRVMRTLPGGGAETALVGQEDLPATYSVTASFVRTSDKTVGVIVTVSDSSRDLAKYPAYTTTTSLTIENLIATSNQVILLPAGATVAAAAAYVKPA